MTVFVVSVAVGLVAFWAGGAHARWVMRRELRGLAHRVGEYTGGLPDPMNLETRGRTIGAQIRYWNRKAEENKARYDLRRPW